MRRQSLLLLLFCTLVVLPAAAAGQAAPVEAAPAVQDSAPPAFEVVTRYRALADSAAVAERTIARHAATRGIASELAESTRREAELQALLASLLDTDFVRPERLSRVRDQAVIEDQRLDALHQRIGDRLEQLGALRAQWLAYQRFWRGWAAALGQDPEAALVEDDLRAATARINGVLEQIAATTGALTGLQQRANELRGTTDEVGSLVAGIRAERRQQLLLREEPLLLSAAHREQLRQFDWRERPAVEVTRVPAYIAFFRTHAGLLLFHALLVVALGLVGRRLRATAPADAPWAGPIRHPWMLALFASAALAIQRVALAPPLWDVLLWTLLGASGAVLASNLFGARVLRRTVYFLAVFYPLFLLLELARLPAAVFRFVTVAGAAGALVIFLVAARRRAARAAAAEPDDADALRRVWPLRTGAALWAVVLLAAVLGYDTFARWVTHAAVTSAAVLFVVVLLVALLRGGIAALLQDDATGRPRPLRRVALPLAQRLIRVLPPLGPGPRRGRLHQHARPLPAHHHRRDPRPGQSSASSCRTSPSSPAPSASASASACRTWSTTS
jgi:hypothetical protein